jgi:hypothetical protein
VVLRGRVVSLANMYTLAFLCVMALFAYGTMMLKYKRGRIRRDVEAPWPACVLALAGVLVALGGNLWMQVRGRWGSESELLCADPFPFVWKGCSAESVGQAGAIFVPVTLFLARSRSLSRSVSHKQSHFLSLSPSPSWGGRSRLSRYSVSDYSRSLSLLTVKPPTRARPQPASLFYLAIYFGLVAGVILAMFERVRLYTHKQRERGRETRRVGGGGLQTIPIKLNGSIESEGYAAQR